MKSLAKSGSEVPDVMSSIWRGDCVATAQSLQPTTTGVPVLYDAASWSMFDQCQYGRNLVGERGGQRP